MGFLAILSSIWWIPAIASIILFFTIIGINSKMRDLNDKLSAQNKLIEYQNQLLERIIPTQNMYDETYGSKNVDDDNHDNDENNNDNNDDNEENDDCNNVDDNVDDRYSPFLY